MVFPGDPQAYLGDYDVIHGNIVEFTTTQYIKSLTVEVIAAGISVWHTNYYIGDVEGRMGIFYFYTDEDYKYFGKLIAQTPIKSISPGTNTFTFTNKVLVRPSITTTPWIRKTANIPGSYYFIGIIGRRFSLYWQKDKGPWGTPPGVRLNAVPIWADASGGNPSYMSVGRTTQAGIYTGGNDFSSIDFIGPLVDSPSEYAAFMPGGQYYITYTTEPSVACISPPALKFNRQRVLKS